MRKDNSILQFKNYGTIHLKLHQLMDEQNITRNRLAREVDTRFEVIDKWYSDQVEKLDLDILARICYVLGCSISDILEYTADPEIE